MRLSLQVISLFLLETLLIRNSEFHISKQLKTLIEFATDRRQKWLVRVVPVFLMTMKGLSWGIVGS